jgi:ribosome-binding protein aMBF1 (putative translation factor)
VAPRPYLRVEFERRRRCLSQDELGQSVRILGGLHRALKQSEISAIEHGRLIPTDDELEALGRVFQISPPSVLLKPCILARDPEEVPA